MLLTANAAIIVMEFLPDGSLRDLIYKPDTHLDYLSKLSIAIGTANGIRFLHTNKIIHRDIKSENVLMKITSIDGKIQYIPTITDFGTAREQKFDKTMTKEIGTPLYMAPELYLSDAKYDNKVDVYSFGILLAELLTRTIPFNGMEINSMLELGNAIKNGIRPTLPDDPYYCPESYKYITEKCWQLDPKDRLTMEEVYDQLKQHHIEIKQLAEQPPQNPQPYSDAELVTNAGLFKTPEPNPCVSPCELQQIP